MQFPRRHKTPPGREMIQ